MKQEIFDSVDIVMLTLKDDGLYVALWTRDRPPHEGCLALPGGSIHPGEDSGAHAAALRTLVQRSGIHSPYLTQLATFSGPDRDPRGWSVAIVYYALVSADVIDEAHHPDVRLYHVDRLPKLAFDHNAMVATAVERLRSRSFYSSLPCYLAGEQFTLTQLQSVYERLRGEKLHKPNFRRKIGEMGILEPVEGVTIAESHRPAQVWRLKPAFRLHERTLERGL